MDSVIKAVQMSSVVSMGAIAFTIDIVMMGSSRSRKATAGRICCC